MDSSDNNIEIVKNKKQELMVLLPNILTASSLACGFSSIMFSLQGRFYSACILIIIAAFFDAFDGRVARLLDSETDFGAQFDSLCDLISFGMAPAILALRFCLFSTGSIAWGIGFFYLVSGAMRLGKFNVLKKDPQENFNFSGLPIPMAAITVALTVLMFDFLNLAASTSVFFSKVVIGNLMILLAALMISKFEYQSFKNFKVNRKQFKIYMVAFILMLSMLVMEPVLAAATFAFVYVLSGPVQYFLKRRLITK